MEKDHLEFLIFGEPGSMDMTSLKDTCSGIFDQLTGLAESLSDEQYAAGLSVLMGNSVGKHFRHILEFFEALLEGLESGRVNYDERKRDRKLETDRQFCIGKIGSIGSAMGMLAKGEKLDLVGSYSPGAMVDFTVSSNAERELVYNIEHAIHHMAIIRIAVSHDFPEISLERDFGYAASTLKYLRRIDPCAR